MWLFLTFFQFFIKIEYILYLETRYSEITVFIYVREGSSAKVNITDFGIHSDEG